MIDPLIINGMIEKSVKAEIFVGTDECVYIKFSGFEDMDEAETYADRINEIVPLLFSESGSIH